MPKATTSRKENAKKQKDPNAPKRPLSAYMFYAFESRERVKEQNPTANFGEIGKILGREWKELNAKDKKPFNDRAAQDKKRYEAEKADYERNAAAASAAKDEEES